MVSSETIKMTSAPWACGRAVIFPPQLYTEFRKAISTLVKQTTCRDSVSLLGFYSLVPVHTDMTISYQSWLYEITLHVPPLRLE